VSTRGAGAVTLRDLEATFIRAIPRPIPPCFHDIITAVVLDLQTHVAFADAHGVSFLCPGCFAKNGGAVGTHWIVVCFAGRDVPPDFLPGIHRWAFSGERIDNLTVTPSVLVGGGCAWHGFVQNGAIVG